MNHQSEFRTTVEDRAGKSRKHYIIAQRTAQRPGDHRAKEQIDKDVKILPAVCYGGVCDIRYTHLVRPIRRKIILEKVVSD